MRFDLIVATHPLHENWEELLQFQPKAKFIQQLGNENQTTNTHNVMSSVWAYEPLEGQNVLYYHPEFTVPEYTPPPNRNTINSFVLGEPEIDILEVYKSNLPEFEIKSGYSSDVLTDMKNSAFGVHLKFWDGYGFLIHQWAAVGRPLIVKGDWYAGKTGGLLLEDGITCIDLDKHTFEENIELIRKVDPVKMGKAMRKKFEEVCNFNKEAKEIKKWLGLSNMRKLPL